MASGAWLAPANRLLRPSALAQGVEGPVECRLLQMLRHGRSDLCRLLRNLCDPAGIRTLSSHVTNDTSQVGRHLGARLGSRLSQEAI